MNLKHSISPLRQSMSQFLYHGRQELVLKVFWQALGVRFNHITTKDRLEMVVGIVTQLAEKDPNP